MKKAFIFIFGLLPLTLLAQIDRSKAPQPGPAPEVKIGKPATFTLPNGLQVFVVQNNKLPRVSATLSFNMDGIVEGDKAGLTSMGGELLRRGTTKMTKAQLDEAIDQLGGSVSTGATSASAASLKANFPSVFALMSDVVLRPSFPVAELEKIRKQQLSGLQAAKDNPDAIATNVSHRLLYGAGHPYGDIETEATVSNVKLDDIKNYFNTWWKPNNAYLVFVGDITPADAKKLSNQYFGGWKRGAVPSPSYKTPQPPAQTTVAIVDRPSSVQSVIQLAEPLVLKPGSPDVIPATVMNNILGGGFSGRLFANLREKHAFTYGAYSNLNVNRLISNFSASASVRNEKTDSAIAAFFYEFNRIRTEPLTAAEVSRMKNYLSGSFARSLESPATIANFALSIAMNKLPADYYQNYLKNLAAVSPTQVQEMAKKYIQPANMWVIIVGNAREVAKGLEKYGPVKYYNVYGQELQAPIEKTVDASVTPQAILQKAIDANGGAAALAAIKDLQMTGKASMMGQNITVSQKVVVPSAYVQEISMQGMTLQKKMLKNGQYTAIAQGQQQNLEEKDKEEMREEAMVSPEQYFLNNKAYQLSLKGIEPVEGKDAYAVAVKTPAGREFTNYYDVQSGLLVKKSMVQETPMGSVTIQSYLNNYKPVNGVMMPMQIVNDLGSMKLEINFDSVKVNSGLTADDIK